MPIGDIERIYTPDGKCVAATRPYSDNAYEMLVSLDDVQVDKYRNNLYSVLNGINHSQFITLGSGYLCEYCGTYTPAGGKNCIKCGAPITKIPYVNPTHVPVQCVSYRTGHYYSSEQHFEATFRVNSHNDDQFMRSVLSNELIALPHGFELDGRWVCAYCGRIVEKDRECSTCGGKRLPYSELVKVDTKCMYCGRVTTAGPVCDHCQGTLSTLTIKALMHKLVTQ